MKGIDISNNDGNIDFQAVKNSGIEIVYLKATEGVTYDDPLMREYYNGCKATGLKIGFYHFMRTNDPIDEAVHFLNCIRGLEYDCIPMLDIEHDSLKDGSASWRTQQFADYCKSQGVQVGVYTYTSFIKEAMNGDNQGLPLWIAEYGVSGPNIDLPYVGFQYSETGQVPGINTNCDLDVFYGEILVSNKEEFDLENLVVVPFTHSLDKEVAFSLAEVLKCPVIDGNLEYNYSKIRNVYCIGCADKVPFTGYATKIFTGADRWKTAELVNSFIKNGCK